MVDLIKDVAQFQDENLHVLENVFQNNGDLKEEELKLNLVAQKKQPEHELRILVIASTQQEQLNLIPEFLIAENHCQYKIFNATNSTDAKEIIKSCELTLIIADWEILTNESHIGAAKETILTAHNIPLLLLTDDAAFYNKVMNKLNLNEGMIDCIRKPIDIVELNARIKLLVNLSNRLKEAKIASETVRKQLNLRHQELHLELIIHSESVKEKILESVRSLDAYLNNEGKAKLRNMVRQFKWTIKDEADLNFERMYDEMNLALYKQLERVCPKITRSEKRLCAFTLKDHSGTDIAKMIGKSQNCINVAFARLRAKLGVASNKELKKFLQEMESVGEPEMV